MSNPYDSNSPAPPPVDLAVLLDDIVTYVHRFVVLSSDQALVIALWILHTFTMDAAEATAFIAITSAEKRSGKTRLLEILELLVRAAVRAVSVSEAALFRLIAEAAPTMLIDEAETLLGPKAAEKNEAIRGLMNAGNRRGSFVYRCVVEGKNVATVRFEIFCPRAFAGIGDNSLPETIRDRSLPIRLVRRKLTEKIERFRYRDAKVEANEIRERIGDWAVVAVPALTGARPALPEDISDRAADGVEPLLGIADLAGGDWPEKSRMAVRHLLGS